MAFIFESVDEIFLNFTENAVNFEAAHVLFLKILLL